jgi:hypothetical protein
MPFVVVKVGANWRVKNSKTGKVGRDLFKSQENAIKQKKNRERFIKLIADTSSKKKKDKKGKK